MNRYQVKRLVYIVMMICLGSLLANIKIIHSPGNSLSLKERIEWAEKKIQKINLKSGCWIGYSIPKKMGKNSWMGSMYCDGIRST